MPARSLAQPAGHGGGEPPVPAGQVAGHYPVGYPANGEPRRVPRSLGDKARQAAQGVLGVDDPQAPLARVELLPVPVAGPGVTMSTVHPRSAEHLMIEVRPGQRAPFHASCGPACTSSSTGPGRRIPAVADQPPVQR